MVLKVNSIIFIFTVVDIIIIILVLIVIDSHGPNSESSSTFRDHKQSPPKGGCVLLGNLSLNFLGDFKSSNRPWSITVNISLMQFLMTHCMKNDQRKWISINIIFWTQISSFIGIWLPSMAPITQGNFFIKIFKLFNSVGNFFTIWSFNALLQKFSTNNFCKAFYNFKDCLFTVPQIGQH